MTQTFTLPAHCPVIDLFDGTQDFNIWDADFKDLHIRVEEEDRLVITAAWSANLPGIAHAYLGSDRLWWALLMFNGITDSIRGVRVGDTIRIPNRDALLNYLSARRALTQGTNNLPNLSTKIV